VLHRNQLIAFALLATASSLAASSSVAAQTPPSQPLVTSRGFGVTLPALSNYYVQHGRDRTFGAPISNDFQLLGNRVQVFENQVLQAQTDGSVRALDMLSSSFPLTHADGATFPAADPNYLSSIPSTDAPDYVQQATGLIANGILDSDVPDTWNDLPVNFNSTFRASASCADLMSQPTVCDDTRLLQLALDVWGLPTSDVQQDPNNPDLVSQRFQRGIMQYSQSTGVTQAVPIGRWFKQVLIGSSLPDDVAADMAASPFYAQYRPTLPMGLARPADLQATSLTSAFSVAPPSSSLVAASASVQTSPTPVFAPAFPDFGGGATVTPTLPNPGATPPGLVNAAPISGTPGTVVTPVGTPAPAGATDPDIASGVAIPSTPIGPDPCAGDEQIMFAPAKPYVGTDVLIAVTSVRHHDVRTVRLSGPVKSGPVNERAGLNGWVWEWTISPPIDGWYSFTFYTDGARACATSGFNALPAFGATPVPSMTATPAPFATATPIGSATASPTATSQPAPSLAATGAMEPASGACGGRLMRINGTNFGASQAAVEGNVLFTGPSGTQVATILSWTNSMILATVPTGLGATTEQIVVTNSAGATSPLNYQTGAC
jgi:hypothetical protein